MTRKTLLSAVVVLLVLQATDANAKAGLFGGGARFTWDNYKTPIVIQRDPTNPTENIAGNIDVNTYGGPSFAGEFHVIPMDRLILSLGLDFGFFSYKVFPYTGVQEIDVETKATYFTFGFLLGAKFHIIKPAERKATFYAYLAGGKYFTKLKNNINIENEDNAAALNAELDAIGSLAAPAVVQLSIGAEYFVTEAFSLGADILGIRLAFAKSDVGAVSGAGAWSGTTNIMSLGVFSALTVNFGVSGGGGRDKDDDEEKGWEEGGGEDSWSGGAAGAGGAAPEQGGAAAPQGSGDAGWSTAPQGGGATDDSWGQAPAAEAQGGADAGWGAAPEPTPAPPPSSGGWESTPAPPPPPSSGGGASRPKAKKAAVAPKPKTSSAPPPPPPGY